jgi:PDDEXK-like uncharacterized protein DUF3799
VGSAPWIGSMARDAYDRIVACNWSTLKELKRSPAHYRHRLIEKRPDTDAMKRGRATHMAVFEPERFNAECVVWESRRAGKEWESFQQEHRGREVLTYDMHADAVTIGSAARRDQTAAKYLAKGQAEQTMLWSHPPDGIEAKGRVDFVTEDAIVDLKTTRDASHMGFGSQAARLLYHAQAAYYVDGYKAVTGRLLPYVIVAVEAAPPNVVQVYELPPDVLDLGRDIYLELLDTLARCRKQNDWPGYGDGVLTLQLPAWAQPFEEEDVEALGLVAHG